MLQFTGLVIENFGPFKGTQTVDFVDADGVTIIWGNNGRGKTTLLNLILGLTQVSEGRIIFDGEDITQMPMEKRGFNIVFQDYALFPNLNVY